jgi:hypothetical protein
LGRDKLKKMTKIDAQKLSKIDAKNGPQKYVKKVGYKLFKMALKFDPKIDFLKNYISRHGGVENDQNRRRGPRTPIL